MSFYFGVVGGTFIVTFNTLTASHLPRIIIGKGFTKTKRKRKKCDAKSRNFVLDVTSHSLQELGQKLVRPAAANVFSVPAKFIARSWFMMHQNVSL